LSLKGVRSSSRAIAKPIRLGETHRLFVGQLENKEMPVAAIVMPAKAGIQYASASRRVLLDNRGRRVLDSGSRSLRPLGRNAVE
jgi:hypothetical protein